MSLSIGGFSDSKKAAIVFVLATVITSGLNMITTPLFTRLMPIQDYGTIQLYITWYQVLYVIASFAVTNAIVNVGFHDFPNDRYGFLASSMGVCLAFSLILGIIMFILNGWFSETQGISLSLIILMILSFIFLTATQLWISLQRYILKYKNVFWTVVPIGVFSTVLSLFCTYYAHDNFAEIKLWSTYLLQLLLGFVLFIVVLRKGHSLFNRQYWRFILLFNAPLLLHYLSQFVLGSSDRLMINYYYDQEKVAIYSLAYTASNVMLLLYTPINTSIIPSIHRYVDARDEKSIENLMLNIIYYAGSILSLMTFFSPEIMLLLGGEKYIDGASMIPIIASSNLFTMVYLYIANVEFLFGKTKRIAIMTIFAAIMNIVLNIVLLPLFGYKVAALTTLISYASYMILHLLNARKLYRGQLFSFPKIFLLITIFLVLNTISIILESYSLIRYSIAILLMIIIIFKAFREDGFKKFRKPETVISQE